MILYYAMGGGLGHITRALALCQKWNLKKDQLYILSSGKLIPRIEKHIPYPMLFADSTLTSNRQKYYDYLTHCLADYKIDQIILDTFPAGIVGEWNDIKIDVPVKYIARHLKWDSYLKRVGGDFKVSPTSTLVIEPLADSHFNWVKQFHYKVDYSPLIFEGGHNFPRIAKRKNNIILVHTGSPSELKQLRNRAKRLSDKLGLAHDEIYELTPDQGIYPAEGYLRQFEHVVSGAGYNSVALARKRGGKQSFHLVPFARRFDDQFFRKNLYFG